MIKTAARFGIAMPLALCTLSWLAACGDDDDSSSNSETAEDGGTYDGSTDKAGKGGSAGKAGAAGSKNSAGAGGSSTSSGSAGAKAGSGAAGGGKSEEAPAADGGKGGAGGTSGAAGSAGAAGNAGSAAAAGAAGAAGGAAPVDYPDLSNAKARVLTGVNALGGVTFAANGKIYASGDINIIDDAKAAGDTAADKYRSSTVGHKVAVLRFNADGTPDTTFGTNGQTIWESPGGDATSMGLAETDDGSIVVDVNTKYESKRTGVALVKFDNTGKLVTTFGNNGRVDLVFGWTDAQIADYPKDAMGMARYPSDQSWDIKAVNGGKQLVVFAHGPTLHGNLDDATPPVQRVDNDRYIVRVNSADGAIDPTFNGGKYVAVHTPAVGATGEQTRFPSDGSRHGIVEADGSIVSSGYTNYNDGKGNHIVLIRLKPDGSFDDAFHKERAGQPVLAGVAVFNPVPEIDKGFAECYGVAKTPKGYVTTGYGSAYVGESAASSLGWLPSKSVDMVSTRFTGTAVDTTYGRDGVFAAQSEILGDKKVSTFEDRGRSSVIALPDNRALMAGRFGQYPAIFVVTDAGKLDAKIAGKAPETNGAFLFPPLSSDKQPSTSMFYGLALSADGKRIAAGTSNHAEGALLAVLEVKDDGTIAPVVTQ